MTRWVAEDCTGLEWPERARGAAVRSCAKNRKMGFGA
jgi:hypothetical protein